MVKKLLLTSLPCTPPAFARPLFGRIKRRLSLEAHQAVLDQLALRSRSQCQHGLVRAFEAGKPTAFFGIHGGAEWSGAAFDLHWFLICHLQRATRFPTVSASLKFTKVQHTLYTDAKSTKSTAWPVMVILKGAVSIHRSWADWAAHDQRTSNPFSQQDAI